MVGGPAPRCDGGHFGGRRFQATDGSWRRRSASGGLFVDAARALSEQTSAAAESLVVSNGSMQSMSQASTATLPQPMALPPPKVTTKDVDLDLKLDASTRKSRKGGVGRGRPSRATAAPAPTTPEVIQTF